MKRRHVMWMAFPAYVALVVVWSCSLDESGVVGGSGDATLGDGGGSSDANDEEPPLLPCFDADLPLCDDGGCGQGSTCSPPVPDGWRIVEMTGPDGGLPDAACAAPYAPLDDEAGATPRIVFVEAGVTCGCTCTPSGVATCAPTATITSGPHDGGVCGNPYTVATANGACGTLNNATAPASAPFALAVVQPAVAPTCTATPSSSKPTFDGGHAAVCKLAGDPGLCDRHRFCAPTAGDAICVAHEGDVACPNGYVKRDLATSVVDTRSCSACSCVGDAGLGCVGRLTIYGSSAACSSNADPGTQPLSIVYDGGCQSYDVNFPSNKTDYAIDATAPTGSCIRKGGDPDGGANALGVTTVCCAK